MECQTLPSTSSLSNASTELAPRRRTTVLPKARVFILPKKARASSSASGGGSGADPRSTPDRLASADNLLLAAPPSSPMANDTPPVSGPLGPPVAPPLPTIPRELHQVTDYDAMEVDLPPSPPSPLPEELRGPVKLLPRVEDADFPPRMSSASTVPSRRPRASHPNSMVLMAHEPDSGLRQLGVRVAIGGQEAPMADALVSLAQAHAVGVVSRTIPATARGTTRGALSGTTCPYDEFVSASKPSLWKRFTRRFRASLAPGSASQPRPGPAPAFTLNSRA